MFVRPKSHLFDILRIGLKNGQENLQNYRFFIFVTTVLERYESRLCSFLSELFKTPSLDYYKAMCSEIKMRVGESTTKKPGHLNKIVSWNNSLGESEW